ncbi:hypothetical protein D3C85_1262040 [compost metagenome]
MQRLVVHGGDTWRAVGFQFDVAFGGDLAQQLTHWRARQAELVAQGQFVHHRARGQFHAEDPAAQRFGEDGLAVLRHFCTEWLDGGFHGGLLCCHRAVSTICITTIGHC